MHDDAARFASITRFTVVEFHAARRVNESCDDHLWLLDTANERAKLSSSRVLDALKRSELH